MTLQVCGDSLVEENREWANRMGKTGKNMNLPLFWMEVHPVHRSTKPMLFVRV